MLGACGKQAPIKKVAPRRTLWGSGSHWRHEWQKILFQNIYVHFKSWGFHLPRDRCTASYYPVLLHLSTTRDILRSSPPIRTSRGALKSPKPRRVETESLGVRPKCWCFLRPTRWFWCIHSPWSIPRVSPFPLGRMGEMQMVERRAGRNWSNLPGEMTGVKWGLEVHPTPHPAEGKDRSGDRLARSLPK